MFYQGLRTGRNGEPFRILKFRTMSEAAASHNGPRITAKGDPRVTKLGRFLRDSKLNQLAQLINVLKGEISLVDRDRKIRPLYGITAKRRKDDRPGITSLASVIYTSEEKMLYSESSRPSAPILPDKLRLDLIYVRNQSMLLDLDILFRTFVILMPRFRSATLHTEDVLLGPFRLLRRLVT